MSPLFADPWWSMTQSCGSNWIELQIWSTTRGWHICFNQEFFFMIFRFRNFTCNRNIHTELPSYFVCAVYILHMLTSVKAESLQSVKSCILWDSLGCVSVCPKCRRWSNTLYFNQSCTEASLEKRCQNMLSWFILKCGNAEKHFSGETTVAHWWQH